MPQKPSRATTLRSDEGDEDDASSFPVDGPPCRSGETALHTMALCANDEDAVAELMRDDLELEVDVADREGFTALTYAAKCGHSHFVRGLCEQGASVDLRPEGPGGLTPLAECCFYLNVYLNAPERHPAAGMRPVAGEGGIHGEGGESYFASLPRADYVDTVRLLLEAGADPNAKACLSDENVEPLSPLDLLFFEAATAATSKPATACAQLLADAGADLLTRDDTNRLMPHEKASAMGFKAAAALLRAYVLDNLREAPPVGNGAVRGRQARGEGEACGEGGAHGVGASNKSRLADPLAEQQQERVRAALQRAALEASDTESSAEELAAAVATAAVECT